MQINKEITAPVQGMNRDSSLDVLKEGEFIFALNSDSNEGVRHNEPSNYLHAIFPEGYKVIGFIRNPLKRHTLYWLTNPETGFSSIGTVADLRGDHNNEDELHNCTNCDRVEVLSPALESQNQTAEQVYVELVNDSCLPVGEGLNFHIDFPVKTPVIKSEIGGDIVYWEDDRNFPRYMNTTDVSYLFKVNNPCGDDIIVECLQVDKLLQFPEANPLQVTTEEQVTGGNLRRGSYEPFVAYCDENGAVMSRYYRGNVVKIFDINNNILESATLDDTTNYAIKLRIENLDTRKFKFYKLVVVERGVLDSAQQAYEEGVFPTSTEEILLTSSGRLYRDTDRDVLLNPKKVVEINSLYASRPKIEKAKGEAIIGSRKYIHGVKRAEKVNLQPVVNLLSSLAEWQTVIAGESLYEDGALASQYVSHMRDEVEPFSLRFLNDDGSATEPFVMINRPPDYDDLEEVDEELVQEFSAGNCGNTDRLHKWQYYNTAKELDNPQCNISELESIEVYQPETRSCEIEDVFTIPGNSIAFDISSDFTNLRDYIEDNPDVYIPEITPHIQNTYPTSHCYPSFGTTATSGELATGETYIIHSLNSGDNFSNVGFTALHTPFIATSPYPNVWTNGTVVEHTTCGSAEITESEVFISEVNNEVVNKIEAPFPEGYELLPQASCNFTMMGNDGNPLRDTDFEWLFNVTPIMAGMNTRHAVFVRDYNFTNESCATSEMIMKQQQNQQLQRFHFRYLGVDSESELNTSKYATIGSVQAGFSQPIKKTALWFKGVIDDTSRAIVSISRTSDPTTKDTLPNMNTDQRVRVSVFNSCSSNTAIYSKVIRAKTEGFQAMLTKEANSVKIQLGTTIDTIFVPNPFPGGNFFIVVEPFVGAVRGVPYSSTTDSGYNTNGIAVTRYRTAPPHGCFSIAQRNIEYTRVEVSFDSIVINKKETYTSSCKYTIPKNPNCDPRPFKKGVFAYSESTRTYPDNKELFDSSWLKVKPSHLDFQPYSLRERFEDYFTNGLDQEGNYIFTDNTADKKHVDFRCKPIRHFKFPDNSLAPFMTTINTPTGVDTFIFPIGITLDARVVSSMLQIALENNLITEKQHKAIVGFEILKGDMLYSQSVVANGLLFDTYKYTKEGKDVYYSNFPYNALGEDSFHRYVENDNLIKHPFNSKGNNKFTFISPDLLHTKTTLPTEMAIHGFARGASTNTVTELDEHAKWTILGKKARRLATTLASAEVLIEFAMTMGSVMSNTWFVAGLANGTSLGWGGMAIVTAASASSGFVKIGDYRYQWLQTFRNLGALYNHGHYMYSLGEYNSLMPNTKEDIKINKLSLAKYLNEGEFAVLDTGSEETYNINNHLREKSVFLSTGNKLVEYPDEYIQIDNTETSSRSSKSNFGRVGCELTSFNSNIASPYVTLKNYVPDQHGDIGSIRWIPTGKIFVLGRDNRCETVFGGDVFISRFTYKRKIPFFRSTAFRQPDKTTFEYSSKFNVGRARFWCDYETDTEFNGLLLPMPDIDSSYVMDCQGSDNRFYIKRGKVYTAYYSYVSFLTESRMNLNWRYGGKQLKEQFYPLNSDLESLTQERNVGISEQEMINYDNVYSMDNSYSGDTTLPVTYSKEFYKKLSENTNEVIWSEVDLSESSRLQDPYLVYKPLNTYSFDTALGELKRLKEQTQQQAVARFENGVQVFNTVDVIADKLTPQTRELGTGGIFAKSKPLSFVNSSLGFTGTQHFNIIDTEYGDIHIDSDRGQIQFLNNQGTGIEDITYAFQGMKGKMTNWFRKNLPFKIKKYFPNIDVDNPFKGLGISGGYDAVRRRAFITKLDYVPTGRCMELDCDNGNLVVNGNFDYDLNGWSSALNPNGGGYLYDGFVWEDGRAKFAGSNDEYPILGQHGILTPGKTYKISFDSYRTLGGVEDDLPLNYVKVHAGDNTTDNILDNGFKHYEFTITCEGRNYFGIQAGVFTDGSLYIDNVCVMEVQSNTTESNECLDCLEHTEESGIVYNLTKCHGAGQIPVCREGFTYNSSTGMCEKTTNLPLCPTGFYYEDGECIQDASEGLGCITDLVFVVDRSSSLDSNELNSIKQFLRDMISEVQSNIITDKVRVGITDIANTSQVYLNMTNNLVDIDDAITSLSIIGQNTNTIDGLCVAREILNGVGGRQGVNKLIILITDGTQNVPVQCVGSNPCVECEDAYEFFQTNESTGGIAAREYGRKLKDEGIYITTVALGNTAERNAVLSVYGGSLGWTTNPSYPLSSPGDGLYGYATYESAFANASDIAGDVIKTVCTQAVPIDCGCEVNIDSQFCECTLQETPEFIDRVVPIDFTDTRFFEDVSWTVAFKFEDKTFNSYHSFTPNFYNPQHDFFITGFNTSVPSKLWAHTLENNSFQVFQGELKPFVVESVVVNKHASKMLNAISVKMDVLRYQNEWNFAQWSGKNFDIMTIFNNTNNSGRLKLVQQRAPRDTSRYPITNSDGTQSILYTSKDEGYNINYFYNRIKNESRNIPQWLWDKNMISKSLNSNIITFTGKRVLERLKGDSFVVRLENNSESRFKFNLKTVHHEDTYYK